MIKNIIITGGNGQDAKILAKIIKSYNIYFVVNNRVRKKFKNLHYRKIDLFNFKKTFEFIKQTNPVGIIHLASKNETAENKKLKFQIHYKKNFLMTKNLLNSIVKINNRIKFIFAGSSQMFGNKRGVVNEKNKFKGNCHYSNYKIDSYNLIQKFREKFKLNASTLILFNHDSIYRNKNFLLPRIIKYLKEKNLTKLNEIYNENIMGDFSHAEDICAAIYKVLRLKKLPNKIILSSYKFTHINDLILYGLKKLRIKKLFKQKIKKDKKLLLGNNNFAKKKLNWKIKKSSLIAFKEILKSY
jgi:GDP-D-mannose dehydratase